MQRSQFFFDDYAEHYYSSVTYDRFYEVVANKEQLTKLLITPESLKMLQQESKKYQHNIYGTLAASLLSLYPIKRLLPSKGFQGNILMAVISAGVICLPVWWVNNNCRQKMVALKKRIFTENRPNFRKYELTGDICLANPSVQLVQK